MTATHTQSLDDEIQFVKGVGPSFAQTLAKIGLFTTGDVLRHAPGGMRTGRGSGT